jgi:hypothetical protein
VADTARAGTSARSKHQGSETSAWAAWVVFAAVMMVLVGASHVLAGLVALFDDGHYLTTSSGLVVSVDYTQWGWVHLLVGLLVAGAGVAVFAGQVWARAVGVVLAVFSAIMNLVFTPAYPAWSIIMITLDVFVIYALVVHGRAVRAAV